MTESDYSTGYSKAPGFLGIKAPDRLASRYLTEDVGYTMVLFTDLARRLGVPTPVMDSIIELTCVVLERDLREEAPRTLASLGLEGCRTSSCSACEADSPELPPGGVPGTVGPGNPGDRSRLSGEGGSLTPFR
jgi:hypothetical protein